MIQVEVQDIQLKQDLDIGRNTEYQLMYDQEIDRNI